MIGLRLKSVWVIVIHFLLDQMGYAIVIPLLPLMFGVATSPFYLLDKNTANYGMLLMGLFVGAYPLAQFLAAPVIGQYADRIGRRKMLIFSTFGTVVSYLFLIAGIIMGNVWLVIAARLLDGVTGGNVSVAQTVLADVSLPKDRSKNFGLVMAMAGVGIVLGPTLGGFLSSDNFLHVSGPLAAFVLILLFYVFDLLLLWVFLAETLDKKTSEKINWWGSFTIFTGKHDLHGVRGLLTARLLYSFGSNVFTNFIGAYLIARFAMSAGTIGNFYSLVGLGIILTQAVIVRMLAKKFSEEKIFSSSLLATAVIVMLFLLPNADKLIYFLVLPMALTFGLVDANLLAVISNRVRKEQQGSVMGMTTSLKALAQTVSPIMAGVIAASVGLSTDIFLAGALMFVTWVLFWKIGKN